MRKFQFFVELQKVINSQDLMNLRMLYSPIVGVNAISLYQLFLDYYHLNKNYNSFYNFNELSLLTGLSYEELIRSRKKLEAVGLIRTFEKSDNTALVVKINKPLSIVNFRRNTLLFKNCISKISDLIFERIEFSQKTMEINKDEYSEISTKYQELFDLKSKPETLNTIEIALPSIESKEAAISGLTFAQFVFYLTGAKISPSQLTIFQNIIDNHGFSSKSINLIIDYSYTKNNKIVSNYIKKIAEDLSSKEIKDATSVEKELVAAANYHNSGIKEAAKSHDFIQPDETKDWNEIFNSFGGF